MRKSRIWLTVGCATVVFVGLNKLDAMAHNISPYDEGWDTYAINDASPASILHTFQSSVCLENWSNNSASYAFDYPRMSLDQVRQQWLAGCYGMFAWAHLNYDGPSIPQLPQVHWWFWVESRP